MPSGNWSVRPAVTARFRAARAALAGLALLAGCSAPDESSAHGDHATAATPHVPSTGIARLVQGNLRFSSGRLAHPRQDVERRAELAQSQEPFAIVLGCADSRTAPEVVFDQGLGDLFVVRQAGNVLDDHALGSIEYAVEHLHTGLIVVLGHERCGAVAAARDAAGGDGHGADHIASLLQSIRPAVLATAGGDADATCKANIRNVVHALQASQPILQHLVEAGQLVVVGAYYDLDTGVVAFLDEH